MFTIREAVEGDFETIYPLLLEFKSTHVTKNDWRRLFVKHSNTDENYFGYILLDRDIVIGFMGLIFSRRLICGKVKKFCNMTSWIIKDGYRGKGLGDLMLQHLFKLKDYTITNLTSAKVMSNWLRTKYGFKQFETGFIVIPPLPGIGYFTDKCSLLFGGSAVRGNMDEDNIRIYSDHAECKCTHIVLKTPHELCYMILTKTRKNNLPFAEIHYISNIQMLIKHIKYIRVALPVRLGVFGLLLENRILKGHEISNVIRKYLPPFRLYKSDVLENPCISDNLYTELLTLNY
jgi:N-acetylglutamate synthase-like GNAT family acetyltransferase